MCNFNFKMKFTASSYLITTTANQAILVVSCCILLIIACKKTTPLITPPTYYNYQRNDVGYIATYAVDSTVYDDFTKTTIKYRYYIKLYNQSTYTTVDTFAITQQLVYKSNYANDSFMFISVRGSQYRNNKTIELNNNVKRILLNYPLIKNKVWNINAENNLVLKNVTVTAIDNSYTYNNTSYADVREITYENDSNLITKNVELYQYAPSVGLVHRQVTHLQSQTIKPNISISLRATSGYSVSYNLLNHN